MKGHLENAIVDADLLRGEQVHNHSLTSGFVLGITPQDSPFVHPLGEL